MEHQNRRLVIAAVGLTISILLTGGLAVALTLRSPGADAATSSPAAGRRIAFTSDREVDGAIFLMDVDRSNVQRISRADQDFCIFPAWSPDGQSVAYSCLDETMDQATIWTAPAGGGSPVRVSPPLSATISAYPTWSPDGTRLAYGVVTAGTDGETTLYVDRTDGSGAVRRIPLPGYRVNQISWSPTGDRLLLIGAPTDSADRTATVYLMPADGGELTELFAGSAAAAWFPDGERVLVASRSNQTIYAVTSPDEPPDELAVLNQRVPDGIAMSPDGTRVAVTTSGHEREELSSALHVVTLETGQVTTVMEDHGWLMAPDWSPDGTRLLFTAGEMRRRAGADLPYADLWVHDLTSGGTSQLTRGEGFNGLGVWSP
ncbi:MAG: DPP IV N-terminal domain-containing protein [Anaerolineae bacterium]|jgi:Tol biopolymer transport system component